MPSVVAIAKRGSEPEGVPEGAARLGKQAIAMAQSFVCTSAAEAAALLERGRVWLKNAESLDVECKRLNAEKTRWTTARGLWTQAADLAKQAAFAWQRADQERALAALPAATTVEERTEAVAALTTKTITTFRVYSARIVDESQVPRPFWRIDAEALNALARSQKDAFAVPGCELVIEERGRY